MKWRKREEGSKKEVKRWGGAEVGKYKVGWGQKRMSARRRGDGKKETGNRGEK